MKTSYLKSIFIGLVGALVLACAFLSCKKSETVPVGGECSSRDDCQNRNDCMKLPSGKSVCTRTCVPTFKDCPAPTKCTTVNMTLQTGGGRTVGANGVSYCLP